MEIKVFEKLPIDAKKIRTQVFVYEQHFEKEFDDIDKIAMHLVMYDHKNPIATARFYYCDEKKSYVVGRIAVQKEYRGQNLGSKVLLYTEDCIKNAGGCSIYLIAQVTASPFYRKLGYKEFGDIIYDEYCPHIWFKGSPGLII